MRYIRKIDEPEKILAYGYVEEGGLGEFDINVYEEVIGLLPENFIFIGR